MSTDQPVRAPVPAVLRPEAEPGGDPAPVTDPAPAEPAEPVEPVAPAAAPEPTDRLPDPLAGDALETFSREYVEKPAPRERDRLREGED